MTEAELTQTAARLGESAVRELDGERVALAVLARLATEPEAVARPRWASRWVLAGLAAAAAILLALQLTFGGAPISQSAPSTLSVLHELDELDASELEALLETLPPTADAAAHPDPASFDELDAKSLERLLRSLEG